MAIPVLQIFWRILSLVVPRDKIRALIMPHDERADCFVSMNKQGEILKEGEGEVQKKFLRHRACLVCGKDNFKKLMLSRDGFWYVRCAGCGFMYVADILSKEGWEAVFKHMPDQRTGSGTPYTARTLSCEGQKEDAARFNLYLDLIARVRPYSGKMLDIGASTGNFLGAAKEREWECSGLEVDPERVAIIRSRGFEAWSGKVEEVGLELPGQYFDVMTMWETLEHIEDPRAAFDVLCAKTKEGCLLAITVPNANSFLFGILGVHDPSFYGVGHINMFTKRTLAQFLEGYGFQLVFSASYLHPLRARRLRDFFRSLRPLGILGEIMSIPIAAFLNFMIRISDSGQMLFAIAEYKKSDLVS